MQRQRILKEVQKIQNFPPTGIHISPKNDNLKIMEAQIIGPPDTPYENGIFKLEMSIPDSYPFTPPSMKFLTKVYHPNIDDHGRICLDLIKMPPAGRWKPTVGLEGLLIAVRMLLETPFPDEPLMPDIASEFKNNLPLFKETAKMYTEKYAT